MSKYTPLWEYVKANGNPSLSLTFDEIYAIANITVDASFLNDSKALMEYGYQVAKISMEDKIVMFNRIMKEDKLMKNELQVLYETLLNRKENAEVGSYTAYLYEKGLEKILKKVGEECTEVIIAAMKENNKEEVVNEISDLIYHLFVLMAEKNISLEDVNAELEKRSHKTGNLKAERKPVDKY